MVGDALSGWLEELKEPECLLCGCIIMNCRPKCPIKFQLGTRGSGFFNVKQTFDFLGAKMLIILLSFPFFELLDYLG